MAGDLPYQDQRFVSAFYGAMQGLAGQKVGQAKGAVQQASRPGWLSRFFNFISPF
jgi:hypothetical protein